MNQKHHGGEERCSLHSSQGGGKEREIERDRKTQRDSERDRDTDRHRDRKGDSKEEEERRKRKVRRKNKKKLPSPLPKTRYTFCIGYFSITVIKTTGSRRLTDQSLFEFMVPES